MSNLSRIIKDPFFVKILDEQISKNDVYDHVNDELNNLYSSKSKMDWFKNHPLVHIAMNGEGDKMTFGESSKNIGIFLKNIIKNRTQYTTALINKLILSQDFVGFFIVNKTFRESVINALAIYDKSILPITDISQNYQE